MVATLALIHGGGGSAWDWHLVATELRKRGHDPVAVDLPCEDPAAGWWNYADTVVDAIDERRELVVVGHSLGGFTAPLVCARMPVDLLVLVAAMTRYLLCRDDRMFPAAWARRHARERSGIDADEMDGGHYIMLSRPRELAGSRRTQRKLGEPRQFPPGIPITAR